ncbi:MAG TPA: hypothetical protein VMW64_00765 [Dehalococcoidia bacterium]|nr:hypothetical protein [Dehalococcoidia bacterium]
MSWKAEDIKTIYASVTNVDADIGTEVTRNMRRHILQIEAQNLFAGVNLLTLGKRENGAGATTTIDRFSFSLINDYLPKPDGPIEEDALPLYIIEGGGGTALTQSFLRAVCSAAGTIDLIVRYVDVPT